MQDKYILAIDQGTSSTKSVIFDLNGAALAKGTTPLQTQYHSTGFVEQEAEAIFENVLAATQECLHNFKEKNHSAENIGAIGISNQRETFILWDKQGKPFHHAVVWQCKRSIQICENLKKRGLSDAINAKTGLVIDPYFSATKLIWLIENNSIIKQAVAAGEVYFGTVDTWLLYKLSKGEVYATDYTNASRTMLFNLHNLSWDEEIIDLFGLKGLKLPEIRPSAHIYAHTDLNGLLPAPIAITAMIGDSHAAAFGEGCFDSGTAKATLGTGCSILMNIGSKALNSKKGMVTTICWSAENRIDFAYEGVIVSCGATVEWLKNQLQLFKNSHETENMANAVTDNGGVYLVPAFSGLGSPHWQMNRQASLTGITFATNKNHLVRAALEAIAYQIKDVIVAMEQDADVNLKELNTDGGITTNNFVMQFIADVLNKQVSTIGMPDVSALGAALLAGLGAKFYQNVSAIKKMIAYKKHYQPKNIETAEKQYLAWQKAIAWYPKTETITT